MLCAVCSAQPRKYRCPRCSLQYCSIDCYRGHKAACEEKQASAAPAAAEAAASSDSGSDSEFDADEMRCRVTQRQLDVLRTSNDLLRQIGDPALQRLIRQIDAAGNRFRSLEEAIRRDKRFAQFVDELMLLVGAAKRNVDGVVVFTA